MTEETPPGLQVVSPCAKISLNVLRHKTARKLVGKLSSCMHFMTSLVYRGSMWIEGARGEE